MSAERTTYRERTPLPSWVRVIQWSAVLVTAYAVLAGWGTDAAIVTRGPIAAGIVAVGFGFDAVLGGLTVLVQESGILLHLGRVPLIRRRVPFADIVSLESVTYHPLRDFGGWGVRGWGKRKAWTARGNEAVALELGGGRVLLIGSDRPRRLEERIRSGLEEGLNRR